MSEDIDMSFYDDLNDFTESIKTGKYRCTNKTKEKELRLKMTKLLNELDLCWILIHEKHFNKLSKICDVCREVLSKKGITSPNCCPNCSEGI